MSKIAVRDNEFYLPANKESRKLLLKQIISKHLTPHWLQMPRKQADMERRMIRKLVDSI